MTPIKDQQTQSFIHSNRLATLAELNYLLLEVLDRKAPMSWEELGKTCKERSFNFTHSFENTLHFLQLISVVKINDDRSVSRNPEKNFDIKTEQELSSFILRHTIDYLESQGLLKQVINDDTLKAGTVKDSLIIHTDKIAPEYPFIKVLLLNFKIAEVTKNSNDQLIVFAEYRNFFREELVPGVANEEQAAERKHKFFISYAHHDKAEMLQLKNHLSLLVRNEVIETWDGQSILPGEDWRKKISQKLEQADIILFLISPDFIASDYIHEVEMKKAIERYKKGLVKIIPVLLSACGYNDLPIGHLQAVPQGGVPIDEWENRNKAYTNVVEQIKRVL